MFYCMPPFISSLFRSELYSIEVTDNSMCPKIKHGDIVFCDPSINIANGNIVHCWLNGESIIRKYGISNCGVISLIAIDSSYETVIIYCNKDIKPIKIVGKIDKEF